jgi:predicted HNH restriction endonuclease
MSEIQHKLAHDILSIIRDQDTNSEPLTYSSVAIKLGRNKKHAKTVAQACDLLDAAAAYANVPLLALVAIRALSGNINPKAWANEIGSGYRNKIINCSLSHIFTDEDYHEIEASLISLQGYGNHSAWEYIEGNIKRPILLEQLSTPRSSQTLINDTINDLGTDSPQRTTSLVTCYARDPYIRNAVIARAKGQCEYCGKSGFKRIDGTNYLEAHHIIALSNEGADRLDNVIALCADHHREAHYGEKREELESAMISIVKNKLHNI